MLLAQVHDSLHAQQAADAVDEAMIRKEIVHDGVHHHEGDEVGQIGDGLKNLLIARPFHFVEQQRQNDGGREAQHDAKHRKGHGIFQQTG